MYVGRAYRIVDDLENSRQRYRKTCHTYTRKPSTIVHEVAISSTVKYTTRVVVIGRYF